MQFSLAKLKRFAVLKRQGRGPARTDVMFGGMIFLIGTFLLLLAVDGYLFYQVRIRERAPPAPVQDAVMLLPREIDEVIRLLDQRAQEFQALLGSEAP